MRICIKTSLINHDEQLKKTVKGLLKDNTIYYKEDDVNVSITLTEPIVLSRNNSDYELKLIFDKDNITKGNYLIKEINSSLDLNIITKQLSLSENKLMINYSLNNQEFKFQLEYEVEK